MTTIHIAAGDGKVPFHLREGALEEVAELVGFQVGRRRCFVVSDSNVGPLYGTHVAGLLNAELLELPAGEEHKSWPSLERLARWLLENGVERSDVLVAVGGGVVTDLVGFAAAIVLRGLAWVAVPTTVLGMVDASIGGKTGIDLDLGKNLLGCFWAPRIIVADPRVLGTLDLRQVRSGLAEVVKAALIEPAELEAALDRDLAAVASGDVTRASALIAPAVRVKADIVALDEREHGPRAALNLGHTLGHALEAATSYRRFLHGEAVAWGLLAELRLARDRGLLATSEAQTWAGRLEALAPFPSLAEVEWAEVSRFLRRDKKRAGGEVGWVLPRLGGVTVDVVVGDVEAERVFNEIRFLADGDPLSSLF